MKKKLPSVILILILITGLSLLLYPTVSDVWNSMHQSRLITEYVSEAGKLDRDTYDAIWKAAEDYNKELASRGTKFQMSEEELEAYEAQLKISDSGVIGYIEVPKIDCMLPIYRGTDEAVLQVAVGHIEWSSLPVGGSSSHCVISGHRGLPSARLFTDLDQMEEKDVFLLHVMDELLTYEVDQILVVEPEDTDALEIVKGKDYCTLVTCTPYGINSHRLLVRGHRIANAADESDAAPEDAKLVDAWLIGAVCTVSILIILLCRLIGRRRRKKKNTG